MKVAKKSPRGTRGAPRRATLTLPVETYGKIDRLRGEKSRSSWIQRLIENEEERRGRELLRQTLNEEYSAAVVRETLALNEEFPIHDK